MNSFDTTWLFFVCILDLKGPWWLIYSLHYMSSLYTTWVFEAYAVKGICWLVPSSHYMSSQYTTWLFRTYILETNASDGWLTYTTWTPFTLHGFFRVYTGSERALMVDLELTLHQFPIHYMRFWSICCQRHQLVGPQLPLHEFPIHYMAFLNVYTGNERLWW